MKKHIKENSNFVKENTIYIDANQLKEVEMTDTHQISCKFKAVDTAMIFTGEIQKVYLDKKGEAYGYDVYIY